MSRLRLILPILLVVPAAIAGQRCTCADNRVHNGWCDLHAVGYVAGLEIRSADLFEALDAHGHLVSAQHLRCASCLEAIETDGFCAEHNRGWVNGLAYLSPLTYHLAKAEIEEALDTITCPICRKNSESYGWCPECNVGRFGHFVVRDRDAYAELSRAYETLLAARKEVGRCRLCAAAMVADGRCPKHKITFRAGKPVEKLEKAD